MVRKRLYLCLFFPFPLLPSPSYPPGLRRLSTALHTSAVASSHRPSQAVTTPARVMVAAVDPAAGGGDDASAHVGTKSATYSAATEAHMVSLLGRVRADVLRSISERLWLEERGGRG